MAEFQILIDKLVKTCEKFICVLDTNESTHRLTCQRLRYDTNGELVATVCEYGVIQFAFRDITSVSAFNHHIEINIDDGNRFHTVSMKRIV